MNDYPSPPAPSQFDESCVVCDKPIVGNSGTMQVHHEDRRFALCCPMCLRMFARGDRPRSLLEPLMEEAKWKS